mmetsp:Transcript_59690/g.117332  ORF Transcript_59690/g.117332 Transcript_59690/m.117332 type:complete len:285 (+) Transcript_59690:200-1054(+)
MLRHCLVMGHLLPFKRHAPLCFEHECALEGQPTTIPPHRFVDLGEAPRVLADEVQKVLPAQSRELDVCQRVRVHRFQQLPVGEHKVRAPDGARAAEAVAAADEATVQDVHCVWHAEDLALRTDHLLHAHRGVENERAQRPAYAGVRELLDLFQQWPEEGDLVQPELVDLPRHLCAQPWAHRLHDVQVAGSDLGGLVRQEEAPQPTPHRRGDEPVLHHRVQLVHGRAERLLVLVQVGDNAADLPQDHGPRDTGDDDHESEDAALVDVLRAHVAVTHRRDGVAREI